MIYTIEELREMIPAAVDPDYYNTIWALSLYMAGAYDPSKNLMEQVVTNYVSAGYSKATPLPDWPDISSRNPDRGTQNHQLISSRIMAESIVYAKPEIIFDIEQPIIKRFNEEFLHERWRQGRWHAHHFDVFMNCEASGTAFAVVGINNSGMVDIRSVSPLDMIWDPVNKMPSNWSWFCYRVRLTLHEFLVKYSHNFPSQKDAKDYFALYAKSPATESAEMSESAASTSQSGLMTEARKLITEWSFWSEYQHYTFIGGFMDENMVFHWSESKKVYLKSKNTQTVPDSTKEQGANMFGVIPVAVMWDYFSPAVHRPVSKAESTYRIAAQLNHLERRMKQTTDNMPPMNIISTAGVTDDDLLQKLKGASGKNITIDEVGDLIITDHPNVAEVFQRIPGAALEPQILSLHSMLTQQLNAATGVSDAYRGQRVGSNSERITAFEINQIANAQGVQARHARRQFTAYLEDLLTKARFIASQFDNLDGTIHSGAIRFENKEHMALFLRYPGKLHVSEQSVEYQTRDSKLQRRLQQFTALDLPFAQMGAVDPQKLAKTVYTDIGEDPLKLLREAPSPEQMAMMQQQMQSQAGGPEPTA